MSKRTEPSPSPSPAVCSAKLRAGGTCTRPPLPGRRRCGSHGGNNLGSTTAEGREAQAAAARRRWEAARAARAAAAEKRGDSPAPPGDACPEGQGGQEQGVVEPEPKRRRGRPRGHRAPLTDEELLAEAIRLRPLLARPAEEKKPSGYASLPGFVTVAKNSPPPKRSGE